MSSEQETIKRLEAENEKLRKEADWLLHVSSVSGTAELLAKLALVTQHRDNLLGEKDMWRADTLSAEDRATTALQRLATVEAALRIILYEASEMPRNINRLIRIADYARAALASAATDAPGQEQAGLVPEKGGSDA